MQTTLVLHETTCNVLTFWAEHYDLQGQRFFWNQSSQSQLRLHFLSPPVKYFTDRSKAVLLLWIFYVFVLSCVCYVLCASVYMCFLVTCWERADLLALVCGVFCEFVTFPLVSWVRCGTWLYRFLIFAPLLTLILSSNLEIMRISAVSQEWLGLKPDWFNLPLISHHGWGCWMSWPNI